MSALWGASELGGKMLDKDFQQDIRGFLCDISSGIDETNKLLELILKGKEQQTTTEETCAKN